MTTVGEIGNTRRSPRPDKPLRRWFLTWNHYTRGDLENLLHYCDYERECKYEINEEVGEISKIKHLQGSIQFKDAIEFETLKKKFNGCHWEPTNNLKAANEYCSKEHTQVGNHSKKNYAKKIAQKKFKTKNFEELYDWQKSVLTILEKQPDDRTIHWFWEPKGCAGKTTLIKYILKYYDTATYSCACKSADILSIADENKNIYLLNFTRNQEGYCPWSALEQLKDGLISDSKLKKKSNNIVMDSPHVICFANWEPDTSKLSQDRWCIINIESYTVKSEE
ncbi:MAG: hypothetical protein H7836_17205 [Magnetococcus sp. YQC-3]